MDNLFSPFANSVEKIFATMSSRKKPNVQRNTEACTNFEPRSTFPFAKLPFEMQRDILQYLLVARNDQVIRPEETHTIHNKSCFEQRGTARYWPTYVPAPPPVSLPCYHQTLHTQLHTVSQDVTAVAVQVLYGCNNFHVSTSVPKRYI
jgi:hypothetical protein